MACRFRFLILLVIFPVITSGCVSLRVEKAGIGNGLPAQVSGVKEKQSTLADALKICGAPDQIIDLEGEVALVYEKGFYKGVQLSLGVPVSQSTSGAGVNLSGYGTLWKYDRLALFFSPDWILLQSVYVKGSKDPFFRALFKDKEPGAFKAFAQRYLSRSRLLLQNL
jgi:hypothetical protein